jgi:xanthine dehydrogenase accessory factor
MYVVGAIDHAAALSSLGRLLGYRVTVIDPRPRFLTRERFPDADELAVDWPDRVLAREELDARSAVCVLTHDPKLDVPALRAALASPAGYVGAMGGRRTTEARLERLRAQGVADEDVARIHAPIGLDLGAKSPAEVAVAVAAELVALARLRKPAEALSR